MNSGYYFVLLAAITCTSCRRDMQDQPKYTPLKRSQFWPDGRSARPTPAGTIAIDEINLDPAVDSGTLNGTFVTRIPIPITRGLLARGQDRYNIYCSPCHAPTGDGHGMIWSRGFENPADLTGDRVRNAPPGYIYQVIVHGYGAMAPYAYMIKAPSDRWAIVAYIRALELSRQATLDDVPSGERSKLEAHR